MSKQRWFDCHDQELHEGDKVRHLYTGKEELVYECHPEGYPDAGSLGLNASNEAFLKRHPDRPREIYPFEAFSYHMKSSGHRCLTEYEKVV